MCAWLQTRNKADHASIRSFRLRGCERRPISRLAARCDCQCERRKSASNDIEVQADRTLHPMSRLLTGACLEDVNHEVYGGIYSQMVFGETLQEHLSERGDRRFKCERHVAAGAKR